jgi:ABC-type phosphate transport system permease subunit
MRAVMAACAGLTLLCAALIVVFTLALMLRGLPFDAGLVFGPFAVGAALVLLALAIVAVIGSLGAASLHLGGPAPRRDGLRYALDAFSGASSIVVGIAALLLGHYLRLGERAALVLALVMLNAPPLCNAVVTVLDQAAARFKVAALASGASYEYALIAVMMPASRRAWLAQLWVAAGRMAGQTALLAVIAHAVSPLTVRIWQDAGNASVLAVQAARAMLLVALLLLCNAAAQSLRSPSAGDRRA